LRNLWASELYSLHRAPYGSDAHGFAGGRTNTSQNVKWRLKPAFLVAIAVVAEEPDGQAMLEIEVEEGLSDDSGSDDDSSSGVESD